MPFVTVASKGGPHDDNAYVAGYEAGSLDARLEHQHPATLALPVHEVNLPQLELVAMRRGYSTDVEPEADGWAFLMLTRGR
jgi:hypothetical protein